MCEKFVTVIEKSRNSKTGEVSATYTPIQSCPKHCPFLDKGCYAQTGNTAFTLDRISNNATKYNKARPIDIARAEAKGVRTLSGKRPLRLHIVGDCKTAKAAEVLSRAAQEYQIKYKQPVWTYTHAWREIPRDKWGSISVLASCETLAECKQAMNRSYAASIVRLKPFSHQFNWQGFKMVPCKELTEGTKCRDCRACMDDRSLLKENKLICFFPHGSQAYLAKEAIQAKESWDRRLR